MPRCLKMDTPDGRGCTSEAGHRGKHRIRDHPTGEYARRPTPTTPTPAPAGGPKPIGVLDAIANKAANIVMRRWAVSMAKAAGLQVLDPPRS